MKKGDALDPKGLIFESYRIEGITPEECRTIFLDWALSLPEGQDSRTALASLIDRYGPDAPAHPMTRVMREGLEKMDRPRRRGGWRSRPRDGGQS
ncbi:hypothetical protein M8756_09565 [Lutimaribacter sp. EGI FJ00015]|uniref:Uncharacterized protein n=1 Tax=Lutimaribacter degradans TaxID=2945989 RepID=A0ACC5ZWG2_9RHOB|nr:hypothetical protein [Lutimaribacter sp. EGI FJ00013]MCM2562396.1 hypothetical protein [Lutimaribacter sp. EGI FJ00013]MCO0613553.1 hypothetical protein [Lutimaribacter sp. EGI FJ00015]MCO0636525.1 hypothetical protein [Lutimaribacter sp. EGI FJ00014]